MSALGRISVVLTAVFAVACAVQPPSDEPESEAVSVPDEREILLEAFARGYFPGRSGQVFYALEPGEILLRKPMGLYRFMHGGAWDYDQRVPLLFFGSGVEAGEREDAARQQDVAPTLLSLIGVPPTASMTGRVLDVFPEAAAPPAVVAVLVMDGMRRDYFDLHGEVLPTFSRLRDEGAFFSEARIDYLPTVTSAGHTTVATGTDPRIHGIAGNGYYERSEARTATLFEGLSPANMMVLGLADLWALSAGSGAAVVAQGTTPRATVSLAGHGACHPNGRAIAMAMFDYRSAGWVTNPDCYRLPEALRSMNARTIWESSDRSYRDLTLDSGRAFVTTDLFPAFQMDGLLAMIESESVGGDGVADLLLVNFKTLDYVGHYYGPESEEIRTALEALDRELARLIERLESVSEERGFVIALTSDHGMPGEPDASAGQERRFVRELLDGLHAELDPDEKRLLYEYLDTANLQLYVDAVRLEELGLELGDVARAVENVDYVRAAFTEAEVRAASSRR